MINTYGTMVWYNGTMVKRTMVNNKVERVFSVCRLPGYLAYYNQI